MRLRVLSIGAFLGVVILLTGCQANREMQAELVNLKTRTKKQLDLLKQQNEFLNRKMNTVNENVDNLTKLTKKMREELTSYANRPDEVKLEIINEVNARSAAMAADQKKFQEEMQQAFQEQSKKINEELAAKLAEMDKTLNKHTAFVKFIAAQQDSINRVFANRFDSRPWYESIIGKWEDRERAAAEENP